MSKDPNKDFKRQVAEVQTKLKSLEQSAYALPEAKSVRPALSQAANALNAIAFREELERI
jgi:hypothetical protein